MIKCETLVIETLLLSYQPQILLSYTAQF